MKKDTLIYIFDPLCGWCYGFGSTILQLFNKRKDDLEFEVVVGGMITGSRIAPFHTMQNYISGAYKRVEEMTGVKFGEGYLKELLPSETILNSEPPCRALVTFRSFEPGQVVPFAHALQKKQFLDGRDFNTDDVFAELARDFKIDPVAFLERFHSEEMKYQTQQDFHWSQSAGIKGFPTVVLKTDAGYYMVAHGYRPLEDLEKVIATIQENAVKS